MKKAFLYAYFSKNLGDDLFIKMLSSRYPDVLFCVWGNNEELKYIEQYGNIRVLNKEPEIINKLKKIVPSATARYKEYKEKRSDAVIYIGGSIFVEYESWKNVCEWWEYEATNTRFYVLGANFGPYKTEAYRQRMADIFLKMNDVCFRDRYSFDLFKNDSTVRYAPDILLGVPITNFQIRKKQAFFSIINCASKDEGPNRLEQSIESYIQQNVLLIDELIEKGWNVVLSSFCKEEGDEAAIDIIRKRIKTDNSLTIINYDGYNADEIIRSIAESECIFASRFHAMILAFVAKRPVIPFIYSDKTRNVLNDFGFRGRYIDIRILNNQSFLSFDEFSESISNQCVDNIEQYIKESENQFIELDKALNK